MSNTVIYRSNAADDRFETTLTLHPNGIGHLSIGSNRAQRNWPIGRFEAPVPASLAQQLGAALGGDLTAPACVACMSEVIKGCNPRIEAADASPEARAAGMAMLRHANRILDVMEVPPTSVDAEVERLIGERERARQARDFRRSDEIRAELLAMGIQLDDLKDGTRWKRIR